MNTCYNELLSNPLQGDTRCNMFVHKPYAATYTGFIPRYIPTPLSVPGVNTYTVFIQGYIFPTTTKRTIELNVY